MHQLPFLEVHQAWHLTVPELPPSDVSQLERNTAILAERKQRRAMYACTEKTDPFEWTAQFNEEECKRILHRWTTACRPRDVQMLLYVCHELDLDPRKVFGKADCMVIGGTERIYIPLPCATRARGSIHVPALGYHATTLQGLLCILKSGLLLPMPEACAPM